MSTAELERLIEQVKALSPSQRQRVREVLETPPIQGPEDELEKRLVEAGLMRRPPRRPSDRGPNPQPIAVSGKPVSETIIEERR